ncbi:hypothetical protein [Rhodococcus sp. Q]|uniref:hypothetical protein n=1 Tax=Rhodococcus sp. Q TaxID=2502252 RepID=UPI0010F4A85F|nr:hypothetical protein [Rhodococcus sp. Q]
MTIQFQSWWSTLTPSTRAALIAEPKRILPLELVPELASTNPPRVVGVAYWVETQNPPGFTLDSETVKQILACRDTLASWFSDLDPAVRKVIAASPAGRIPAQHNSPDLVALGLVSTAGDPPDEAPFRLTMIGQDAVTWLQSLNVEP